MREIKNKNPGSNITERKITEFKINIYSLRITQKSLIVMIMQLSVKYYLYF
jgi:hypothetical protein